MGRIKHLPVTHLMQSVDSEIVGQTCVSDCDVVFAVACVRWFVAPATS